MIEQFYNFVQNQHSKGYKICLVKFILNSLIKELFAIDRDLPAWPPGVEKTFRKVA